MFLVVCCNGLQGLKMDWNLGQQQDTGHTALPPDKYKTDSDQIVTVPRKVTLQ